MASSNVLLTNALILDTETLDLGRGSGIRELAIFNFQTREVYDILVKPNFVAINNVTSDEALAMVTRSSDRHRLYTADTWDEIYRPWLKVRGFADPAKTDEYIRDAFSWLHKERGKLPYLQNRAETAAERTTRAAYIAKHGGATLLPMEEYHARDLFAPGGRLEQLLTGGDQLKGRTIWLANAAFDSKQVGAAYAALEQEGTATSLDAVKGRQQTFGTTVDPFYVTGVEVNKARSAALASKDWTPVWEAYLKELPKDAVLDARGKILVPAEHAYRDVQDVLRAMASYGEKLGIRGGGDVYQGTGLDVMHRFIGSMVNPDYLLMGEAHRAAEDTTVHTQNILKFALEKTEALQNVYEETPEGKRLLAEAAHGRGALHDMRVLYARLNTLQGEHADVALWQRLGRGADDLLSRGVSPQTEGSHVTRLSQKTPAGDQVKVEIRISDRTEMKSLEEIISLMQAQGRPVDNAALQKAMPRLLEIMALPEPIETRRIAARKFIASLTDDYVANQIASKQGTIMAINEGLGGRDAPIFTRSLPRPRSIPQMGGIPSAVATAARKDVSPILAQAITAGKWGAGAAAGTAALGGLFLIGNQIKGWEKEPDNSSLVTYDYREWLQHQEDLVGTEGREPDRETPYFMQSLDEFMGSGRERVTDAAMSGMESVVDYSAPELLHNMAGFYSQRTPQEYREGMSHRGLAGRSRTKVTDFGSPYQGIMGSQMVFAQQDLLEERERWLRQQYALTYDPNGAGLFGMRGMISRARHTGYSYAPGGMPVQEGYGGTKKRGLRAFDLNSGDWKIKVDDADTVLLQRAGIRGLVGSVFGNREQYSFRLSGIDAPEVSHRDELTGQPLYHTPQPGGSAGARGLQQILAANRGQLELLVDPSESTYGRQLGVLYAGGMNVNYELVRRGHAAFLPFGKEENDMLNWSVLSSAQSGSAKAGRGMWQHPYWKAYYGISQTSGQSITFNTFTRMNKIAQSQSTMDTLALMEHAERSGFYNNAMALEASRIGIMTHVGPDKVTPVVTGKAAAHYDSYLHEVLSDTSNWMKTHGTGYNHNKFSARGGYRNLDKALVLDSMGQTNSIWAKRRLTAFDRYASSGKKELRRYKQMMQQQEANQNIFNSNIKHYEYN